MYLQPNVYVNKHTDLSCFALFYYCIKNYFLTINQLLLSFLIPPLPLPLPRPSPCPLLLPSLCSVSQVPGGETRGAAWRPVRRRDEPGPALSCLRLSQLDSPRYGIFPNKLFIRCGILKTFC